MRLIGIEMTLFQVERRTAILQAEAKAIWNNTPAHARVVALDEGDHVTVFVTH